MCSWCYGFSEVAARLAQDYADQTPMTVCPGGLRIDEKTPMPEPMAQEISRHWQAVAQASQAVFDFDFFQKHPGFVYNTAPACRAVVAAGRIDRLNALRYQSALQHRFYAAGEDPTDHATFLAAAQDAGIAAETFALAYDDPATEQMTRELFDFSRRLGIHGYPTLVLRLQDRLLAITRGYIPYDALRQRVAIAFQQGAADASVAEE